MLNKNIVHLIDDIFWNMGFKTETQADKVMPIISILSIISIISIISLILIIRIICRFIRILPGLADHVWQDRRSLIAQSVDNLDDQFRPVMRAGWLSYIRRAYPEDNAADACLVVEEGILVVPD
jgi:hypothetical protein